MGAGSDLDLTGKDLLENAEVVQALKNFGFSVGEAQKAVREVKKEGFLLRKKSDWHKNLGK